MTTHSNDAKNATYILGGLLALASALPGVAHAADVSTGLYSIPYEAGTRVRVTNDHLDHSPPNRIDMSGTSGGPYRVVAAASGHVRFIEDSHNVNGGCANNNYVWIEHANGEWTKYSHIAQYSASDEAGLDEGDFVSAGQFLGIESDIGCASGDHVHFEVAVPDDDSDPIDPVGGYIKGVNRIPRVCGIEGQTYESGQTYTVPDVRPGYAEYARHGLSHNAFQAVFDAAANCGYQLDWNDGYDVNGTAHFNVVFHPKARGVSFYSHRMLTAAQLDDKIDEYVGEQDFALVHLDAYSVGTAVRYAAIFKRGGGTLDTETYHGLSASQHQDQFDALTAAGWKPRVISVASVNGTRTYAAVYQQVAGAYFAKSFQTSGEYQTNFDDNKAAGRRLVYLNSYLHNGEPRYTAIWASTAPAQVPAKHGMSAATYQDTWEARTGAGYKTRAVTAFYRNGAASFAAFWTP